MSPLAIAVRRVGSGGGLEALPPAERALLGPRATSKRRAEFAAGRIAARAALVRLRGPSARGCVVLRAERAGTARPVPIAGDGEELPSFVSITHAAGFAVAIAGAAPLGVDLVEVEDLGRPFEEEAFSEGEVAAWAAFTGGARAELAACAGFAAKEAVVKWLGTGLSIPLRSLRAVPAGGGGADRLGRLAVRRFALDVQAPGVRRRLVGLFANPGRFVLVATCEEAGDPTRRR